MVAESANDGAMAPPPRTAENGSSRSQVLRMSDHRSVMRDLLPFVFPKERPDLRFEVMLGCVALVAAKIVTVLVPLFYKWAVDWLTLNGAETGREVTVGMLALVPAMLVIAYGVGRVLMMVLAQVRDVLFTKVAAYAVREITNRLFRHLHRLSLRFHLERRTGALSRVMERGTEAIDTIIRMGIMNSVPTALELVLICGMLVWYFGIEFVAIVLGTVAAYLWFTVKASEWRMGIRREMNESDRDANGKAIDSLLNYETVKYFSNEEMEARRLISGQETGKRRHVPVRGDHEVPVVVRIFVEHNT